jgi:hypothetical protein
LTSEGSTSVTCSRMRLMYSAPDGLMKKSPEDGSGLLQKV